MTTAEQHMVMRLAENEPAALLSLLAGCLAPLVALSVKQTEPTPVFEHRSGDDPYLITEEEFSHRARFMRREEQAVLRCRVNAARLVKNGLHDHARRERQRADRLEKKLQQEG